MLFPMTSYNSKRAKVCFQCGLLFTALEASNDTLPFAMAKGI